MRKKPIPEVIKEPFFRTRWHVRTGEFVAGYRCGKITIKRRHDESVYELRERCKTLVEWHDVDEIKVFTPL